MIDPSSEPLGFDLGVFMDSPISELVIDRPIIYKGDRSRDAIFINRPFNNNPALKKVWFGSESRLMDRDFLKGCTGLNEIVLEEDGIDDTLYSVIDNANPNARIIMGGEYYSIPRFKSVVHFRKIADKYVNGVKDMKGCGWISGNWVEFNLDIVSNNINGFHKMLYDMSDVIIDEWDTPFQERHCSGVVNAVANNMLAAIAIENGATGSPGLQGWANMDLLRKEKPDSLRVNDYQILLALSEKLLKTDPVNNIYACALQLAGLCGSGRWKEAADYYPKAHRLITENGKYAVPYEMTYMRNVINEHGFKVKDPVYTKKKVNSKSSKQGYKSNALLEYFFDKAYEKYKEHRDMRRFKKWLRKTGRI